MRLFYHGDFGKNSAGFLKFSLGFVLLILAIAIVVSRFITWQQIKQLFGQNQYRNVDINSLVAYSNLYSGQTVCTEGIHVKSNDFNVLKINFKGDQFTNAILVKYIPERERDFDSFIPVGMAAGVSVCGKFERQPGKTFSAFGAWNSQITIDTYKLVDTPKPFTFN